MKKYELYKDSGVEWIGKVPEHWNISSLKRYTSIKTGSTPSTKETKFYDSEDINWFTPNDFQSNILSDSNKKISNFARISNACKIFPAKSIYMIGIGGTIGKVAICDERASANQQINVIIPNKKVHYKYIYYCLCSQNKEIILSANIVTLPIINQDKTGCLQIPVPTLREQQAIATYLDKRCQEIDKAIATQQKRINLLQELRQNVITHAVTRGLNPNVPLKDSKVEWIGMVPEHWKHLRLRFVCELRNGYTPSKANPEFWTDGTIPWYRMEDIRQNGHKLKEANQYVTKKAVKNSGLFEAGSFILATTATIGEHAMLIVDSLANQRFTNLKIRKSLINNISKDYFYYYLFLIDEYCKSTTRTATFPAVNMEDLKNFLVLIPTLNEQQEIVRFIKHQLSRINSFMSMANRQIELLQELKQSIITEAVTGKVKVYEAK